MKNIPITSLLLFLSLLCTSPVCAQDGQLSTEDKLIILKQPAAVSSESTTEQSQRAVQNNSLLEQKKYDELDKIARELRKSGATTPQGLWKLDLFYNSFVWVPSKGTEKMSDQDYVSRIAQITAWADARPNSSTALIALSHVYYKYAWFARGGGFADKVTDTGWKLMKERNALSHQLIDKAMKLPEKDPRAYYQLLRLAKEEGNHDNNRCKQLIKEARAQFPTYKNTYFVRVLDLQPRWNGEDGEWEQFAKDSADSFGGIEGDKLYAQIVWAVERTHWYRDENIFRSFKLDYPRVKRGMTALQGQYPNSFSLTSMFCCLASHAGDKTTARQLFKQLAGRVDKDTWNHEQTFEYWRNYACS